MSKQKQVVRIGVIGTSPITDSFLSALETVPGASLVAVYSRSQERATAFAEKHQNRNSDDGDAASTPPAPSTKLLTFTSLEALAASDQVDAVYIASPTSEHARQAVLMLRHQKHVLCEKPACSNRRELEEVLSAAQSSEAVFVEAMRSLKTPNFTAFTHAWKALEASGEFASSSSSPSSNKVTAATLSGSGGGKGSVGGGSEEGNGGDGLGLGVANRNPVTLVTGSLCQVSSKWPAFRQQGGSTKCPNAFLPDFSNGALMDLGVYCVYPTLALLGPVPAKVSYSATLLPTGVDGGGTLVLQYPHAVASFTISKMSQGFNWQLEAHSDAGTLRVDR